MSTAVECVREVFPASAIKTIRVDNPLRVTIAVEIMGKSQNFWTCKQHNLFQRNPKRRRRAMDSIRQCMADLKEQLAMCSLSMSRCSSPATSSSTITTESIEKIMEGDRQVCSYLVPEQRGELVKHVPNI